MDILNRIRLQYNRLTKSEKKLADFCLDAPTKTLDLTITDLADRCSVSEATVTRFACHLGLKGYQDFKRILADELDSGVTPMTLSSPAEAAQDSSPADRLLQRYMAALSDTRKLIDPDRIRIAADWIASSGKVLFLGVGHSYSTALTAYSHFSRVLPAASISMDNHMQLVSAATLGPGDLAFLFSYSGSSKDTVEMARAAKARGARTIALTHYAKSPLTLYADLVLLYTTSEPETETRPLLIETAGLYIIQLLYQEYIAANKEAAREIKRITAEALVTKVY